MALHDKVPNSCQTCSIAKSVYVYEQNPSRGTQDFGLNVRMDVRMDRRKYGEVQILMHNFVGGITIKYQFMSCYLLFCSFKFIRQSKNSNILFDLGVESFMRDVLT